MPYIKFSDEEIERAGQVDLVDLLKSQGEDLKKEGSWYRWYDGDQKVSIKGNIFYHQYEHKRGNAIDFVRRFMNKSFADAVNYLLDGKGGETIYTKPRVYQPHIPKPFRLPPEDSSNDAAENYLIEVRRIDEDVVEDFIDAGLVYQTSNKGYKNVVFVGIDENEEAKHAHLRGVYGNFKGNIESSDDRYSFHWNGTSNEIYLFEAPIDLMSFVCMNDKEWQEHTYVAACGVSDMALLQCLKDHPELNKVYLCLDNDLKGLEFDERIATKLSEMGYDCKILVPNNKDWNEDLKELVESEEEQCSQAIQ